MHQLTQDRTVTARTESASVHHEQHTTAACLGATHERRQRGVGFAALASVQIESRFDRTKSAFELFEDASVDAIGRKSEAIARP